MLSAQNVATYVDVEYDVHASFLIRVAPGPNSALTLRLTLGKMTVPVAQETCLYCT